MKRVAGAMMPAEAPDVKETEPTQLWSTKQRQGHSLHRICAYQGTFPPQLPAYYLDQFPGEGLVLDPFCGRGTTLLEAVLKGRPAAGFDINPTARAISRVKAGCAPRAQVLREIQALMKERDEQQVLHRGGHMSNIPLVIDEEYGTKRHARFAPFYDINTFRDLWWLQRMRARLSNEVVALILGRMHGHSPGFFSAFTFNVVSVKPERLLKMQAKHGTKPEFRDVLKLIDKAARGFLVEEGVPHLGSVHAYSVLDAAHGYEGAAELIITSPPFYDVIDYAENNWLRNWFLGFPDTSVPNFSSKEDYAAFMARAMTRIAGYLKPGGHAVIEVGPVKKNRSMYEVIKEVAPPALQFVRLDRNVFHETDERASTPKISRAMRSGEDSGKETTTMENQCVVFRRV